MTSQLQSPSVHCNIFICLHSSVSKSSVSRNSDYGCSNEEDSVWRIQWPATAPDSTQSASCPGEGDKPALGLTHSLAGGVWDSVDASECESGAVKAVRMRVGQFHENSTLL